MKPTITLHQAIDGYLLDAAARRLSADAIHGYSYIFNRMKLYFTSDPAITSITSDQARQFLAAQDTLSNTSLHHFHAAMSSLWKWALRDGLAAENIMLRIPPPRPEEKEIQPFSKEEIKAMLGALETSTPYTRPGKRECAHEIGTATRNRAIILLMLDTGIRATELCDMRIADVDLKTRHIIVMGKGNKQRIIPISPQTGQAVWRYLATRKDEPINKPLFISSNLTPLNRDRLNHLIRNIGQRAGVQGAHPHRFRHTFAINYLRALVIVSAKSHQAMSGARYAFRSGCERF